MATFERWAARITVSYSPRRVSRMKPSESTITVLRPRTVPSESSTRASAVSVVRLRMTERWYTSCARLRISSSGTNSLAPSVKRSCPRMGIPSASRDLPVT